MKFVGLGVLPESLKLLVCWTDEEYEQYFELLKTRRQDLRYVANQLGKSFIEVQALTQKLDHAAAGADPLDPSEQEIAYEVPDNFDSVYEPGDAPQAVPKSDDQIELDKIWEKTTLTRWAEVCGVEWTQNVADLLTAQVHRFILEAIRKCEADELIGTLSTSNLKLSREEDMVRLGYGGATPHVFSQAEKAWLDANEGLIDTVDNNDANWFRLHLQDYVLDIDTTIPPPLKSGLYLKPSPKEEHELEALDQERQRLDELDAEATVDYIRAVAAAKGSSPSLIDHFTADFARRVKRKRVPSATAKDELPEPRPVDWIKPERLSGVSRRAMQNRKREEQAAERSNTGTLELL